MSKYSFNQPKSYFHFHFSWILTYGKPRFHLTMFQNMFLHILCQIMGKLLTLSNVLLYFTQKQNIPLEKTVFKKPQKTQIKYKWGSYIYVKTFIGYITWKKELEQLVYDLFSPFLKKRREDRGPSLTLLSSESLGKLPD